MPSLAAAVSTEQVSGPGRASACSGDVAVSAIRANPRSASPASSLPARDSRLCREWVVWNGRKPGVYLWPERAGTKDRRGPRLIGLSGKEIRERLLGELSGKVFPFVIKLVEVP